MSNTLNAELSVPEPAGVLIVGASVAGVEVATQLAKLAPDLDVTLADAQPHDPYDRPPLSKTALLDPVGGRRALLPDAHGHTLVLGDAVTDVDVDAGTATTAAGRVLAWQHLVLATGAQPLVPSWAEPSGAHVLRTVDDAAAIAARATTSASALVIGGGLVGAEVAATLAGAGLTVTLVDGGARLSESALGRELADQLTDLHRANGVTTVLGRRVADHGGSGRVVLDDGATLDAELVVAALGVVSDVALLQRYGVADPAGAAIRCDAFGRVAGLEQVYALGDAAAWLDVDTETHVAHRHWTNAVEQARVVAGVIARTSAEPHRPSGYVWSDQFGMKFEKVGRVQPDLYVETIPGGHGGIHLYTDGDRLVGASAAGAGRAFAAIRKRLRTEVPLAEFTVKPVQTKETA